MSDKPPGFLARISIAGKFQGSGILIRPDRVLTCAHVVEQAGPNDEIQLEINGATLSVKCPEAQRGTPQVDLALIRLAAPVAGVTIPEWRERVASGCKCVYFGFPGGVFDWGDGDVRNEHSKHLLLDLTVDAGASGGALTRLLGDEKVYVGLLQKGKSVVSQAFHKVSIDEFLESQDEKYYLNLLRGETGSIELRDIGRDDSERDRPPEIHRLYQPLNTPSAMRAVPLEEALANARLVIEGGPGSGKTTFLRRIAWALCRLDKDKETLKLPFDGFPLWLRIRDLDEHMTSTRAAKLPGPTTLADRAWIPHFFAHGAAKLDERFVERKLADPNNVLLIDGLDEAGTTDRREAISAMIQTAEKTSLCRFVVSTRPGGDAGKAALPKPFEKVVVAEWERPDIEAFCLRWSRWLRGNEDAAVSHARGLAEAVAATPRRLRSNPLMLTALAVIYRPDTRLPDERALLYEAIMAWLAKKAEDHARAQDRPAAAYTREECLKRLGRLAIEMQNWKKKGLVLRVGIEDGAREIAHEFSTVDEEGRFAAAKAFLEEAQRESGIVTLRGQEIEFWHRSFQEYLAARRLKGFVEKERLRRARTLLHSPEGREVLPLFAGSMTPGGNDQLEEIFAALMKSIGGKALPKRAHAVGVLGAMLADIRKTYRLDKATQATWDGLLNGVMEIFDVSKSEEIDLETRRRAAEALGGARDPRLFMPWEDDYWVTVPAGAFTMGAQKSDSVDKETYDEEAYPDETPRRVKFRTAFDIGRFPVTVWEYGRFLEDQSEAREPDEWPEQSKHPNWPVTRVSLEEARAYCGWASRERTVDLPTEEQWEFAARGPEGRKFPWGWDPPTPAHANYQETNMNSVTPVGLFPLGSTKPGGIADLAGNVWEWTRSPYGDENRRCVRGGSFVSGTGVLRAALRNFSDAGDRDVYLGFRCIRE
jgi:hypothetical protein